MDKVRVLVRAESYALAPYKFAEGFMVTSRHLFDELASGKLTGDRMRVFARMCSVSLVSRSRTMLNRVSPTQAKLAEDLNMQRSHVSRAVAWLVENGYLVRMRDEAEGRVYLYIDARRTFGGAARQHAGTLERQAKARRSNVHQLRGGDAVV